MLDLQSLYYLVTVADCKTLSAAADELAVTQPALSRSIQRLEDYLGMELFDRQKNHIRLNEAGKMTVDEARTLLRMSDNVEKRLEAYKKSKTALTIGSCAPGPLWLLSPLIASQNSRFTVASVLDEENSLKDKLLNSEYQIIITTEPVNHPGIFSKPYVTESLKLAVPQGHVLAEKSSVTFADLKGLTMLLYTDIGVWNRIHETELKDVHFIVQNSRKALIDLIAASDLPNFVTDLTHIFAPELIKNRITVPVAEKEAVIHFWISSLNKKRNLIENAV